MARVFLLLLFFPAIANAQYGCFMDSKTAVSSSCSTQPVTCYADPAVNYAYFGYTVYKLCSDYKSAADSANYWYSSAYSCETDLEDTKSKLVTLTVLSADAAAKADAKLNETLAMVSQTKALADSNWAYYASTSRAYTVQKKLVSKLKKACGSRCRGIR